MAKRTPMYETHVELGAKMVDFAGWEMPIQYTSLVEEHEMVRKSAGLFDVSHMGEIFIRGKDALAFVEHMLTNKMDSKIGKCTYAMMLLEDGGVVDDLISYRLGEDEFLLVVNASNTDKDYDYLLEHKGDFDVEIANESDKFGQVAIQGPKAEEILQEMTEYPLQDIPYYHFKEGVPVDGKTCLVSRSGYTGEDGFEVYLPKEEADEMFRRILEVGGDRIVPVGLGARDTLRFEAGMPLYGNEMDETITPDEAGLRFAVKPKKGEFIGREAILKKREEGVARKLIGLELLDRGIVRHGYPVFQNDQEIGVVTTGYLSPSLGIAIANALVDAKGWNEEEPVEIQVRKRRIKAKVRDRKYLK